MNIKISASVLVIVFALSADADGSGGEQSEIAVAKTSLPPGVSQEVLVKPNEKIEWPLYNQHDGKSDDYIDISRNYATYKGSIEYAIDHLPDKQQVVIRYLSEKIETDRNGKENDNSYMTTGDGKMKLKTKVLKEYPRDKFIEIRGAGGIDKPVYTRSTIQGERGETRKELNPTIYPKEGDSGPVISWYWKGSSGPKPTNDHYGCVELKPLVVLISDLKTESSPAKSSSKN